MILISVGTQLPFDRLVQAVDAWALETGRTDVVGQVGHSHYAARAIKTFPFVGPDKFHELQLSASAMVSHAGMGSILTALEYGKPIVIMPRSHRLGEHRNDHQTATASRFRGTPGIHVAADVTELRAQLAHIDKLTSGQLGSAKASEALTRKIRAFIEGADSEN